MADRPAYPAMVDAPEGRAFLVQLDYKTDERGQIVFGEHRAPGEAVLPRVRLPRWLWSELGKPRYLTVTVKAGRYPGLTPSLFDAGPVTS